MKCSAFKWIVLFWRDPFALLIADLAILGTAHILIRTASYGPAVWWDSVRLLSTAVNFLAGEGWREFSGGLMVGWPPLFPLLLAAGGWLGSEPFAAGRWINAIAFGLTILAAGLYLRSNLRAQWLGLAATATIVASLPLSEFAATFMADFLFALFALLALIRLAAFLQRGGATPLLGAAGCTALATLTRYPGVVLIGTGVLLLLVRRTPPLATRLKQAIVFGAVSSLPLAGVLTRNWAVSGTLTGRGDDPPSGQSLSAGLHQIAEVFRGWIVPLSAPDGLAYLLGLVVAAVGLAGAAVVLRGRQPHPEAAPAYFRLGPALPFAGFAVAYLSFMVAIVPFTVTQGIDSRYLLPVYVPLLLAAVLLLDRFLSIKSSPRAGWAVARYGLASLVLTGALAHIGYSAHSNLTITDKAWRVGYEDWTYNGSYWESSETLKYNRDHRLEGKMYSNSPCLAWFWDRSAPVGKHHFLPRELHLVTSGIVQGTDGAGAHILWLQDEKSFFDYDDFDIRLLDGVEPVAELSDGVVFRVTAAEPFDAARHRARKQRYVQQLIQQAGEPVVRAGWDVYLNERTLTYHKQPCTPADVQTNFVLQVIPVDPAHLIADRQQHGFDHLDFNFNTRGGVRFDDECVATVQLPDYPIGRLYIGQWIATEDRILWEMEAQSSDAARYLGVWGRRYVDQLIEQTGEQVIHADSTWPISTWGAEPADEQVIRAGWDVYRNGRKLTYRKKPCSPDDAETRFVLQVVPDDPADLTADRQSHGFDHLDFHFRLHGGVRLNDQIAECVATAQLPDYPIGRIYIGRWIDGNTRTLWDVEF